MKRELDIENWKRKEHFHLFSSFDDPFFGITTTVDCTTLLQKTRAENIAFNTYLLYKIMKTVNKIEEFKYRIEDGKIFIYNKIHISSTIAREDETFCFSFFEYDEDFSIFIKNINEETEEKKRTTGIQATEESNRIDAIHYSSVPWISFTDMKHPMSLKYGGSVPKISVGKYYKENEVVKIPISITAHHGLMDGLHVGKFLEQLQKYLNDK